MNSHPVRPGSSARLPRPAALLLLLIGLLPASLSAAELDTTEAVLRELPRERVLDALVEAVREATVSAQINGRIVKIYYDVDDYVEKGAVLLRFRDTEVRARFEAAKAAYDEARTAHARVKELFAKNLVSKSQMDKAEARLKAAKARLDEARENLANTQVRAPYSGIVVKRHVEVGELARVGQPLFTGISLEELRATANVPEDIINVVRRNKTARVILDRADNRSVPAESVTISPYADPATHTFNVRVNLPKGDYHIYPGMFAKVAFLVGKTRELVIPRRAVAHRSEVTAVYVVDEQGRIAFRQIRVGRHAADDVVVLAGLSEGEKVVLDPVKGAAAYKAQHAALAEAGDHE